MQTRPVEKAAPPLSGPVGGSVSYVLGLGDVVLGDGGVSSAAVGMYVSVGDVSVAGGGETNVSGVDIVVSGADTNRVSRCDIVVSVGDISLSGGDDAVVSGVDESVGGVNSVMAAGVLELYGVDTVLSGVDESVCGVNSVMSAGIIDLCGVDTLVSGVDEPVCGVSSMITDGELGVCVYDSILSVVADEPGDSSGVEVVVSVDDVVACCDDPLLPDVVCVGDWLSVVGDTLEFGAGVALSGRGDTDVVVGPGVAQPGLGGRVHLRRRFPAARATTDAPNVFESYFIGCRLLIRIWRLPLPLRLYIRLVAYPYTYLYCIV